MNYDPIIRKPRTEHKRLTNVIYFDVFSNTNTRNLPYEQLNNWRFNKRSLDQAQSRKYSSLSEVQTH